MDIFNALNESINQFSDLYNVPKEIAYIAVPAILIIGISSIFWVDPLVDAIASGSS